MKKYITLFVVVFFSISIYSQENIIWSLSFKNTNLGPLTEAELDAEGDGIDWMFLNNNSYVVDDIVRNNSLKIKYPAGHVGPDASSGGPSGSQFIKYLPSSKEYYLDYYVKFDENFEFVKGGKLPGLTSGGSEWTGGNKPTNGEGFSARYMWVQNGKMLLYFYYWDMKEAFEWEFPLGVDFVKGKWYRLTQRIKLNSTNTPGQGDGILQVWVDGEIVIDRNDIRFMNVNSRDIDTFYFSTFYGGATSDWAPQNDTFTYFDKFIVSTDIPDFTTDFGTSTNIWKSYNVADFSGVFNVKFNMQASQNNMDGVTGILHGNADDYSDLSCIVRFNPNGTLDAYDGNTYKADNIINYDSSNLFSVKMQIDVNNQTYDVYVSKDGGEYLKLASGYKFRNSDFNSLNTWAIYAYVGSHTVSNMTFTDGGLSNKSYELNDVKVYPTCVYGNELTLFDNNAISEKEYQISLLSVDGRFIESKSVVVKNKVNKVAFNSLNKQKEGIYLIYLKNEDSSKIIKILKK